MGNIPPVHDSVISYTKVKSSDDVLLGFKASEEYIDKTYNHDDNDGKGPWTTSDLSANHEGPYFEITNPSNGAKHWPPKGRYWVFNEKEVASRIADGQIIFGISGSAAPIQKKYLRDRGEIRLKPESWWDQHGYNSDGTDELFELFNIPKIFVNSKPTSILKKIIEVSTRKSDIILDFFAGSGSTAHAVLSQNALDKSQRSFISVQLAEETSEGSEARKAGYETIFNITRERIMRAAKKSKKTTLIIHATLASRNSKTFQPTKAYLRTIWTMPTQWKTTFHSMVWR